MTVQGDQGSIPLGTHWKQHRAVQGPRSWGYLCISPCPSLAKHCFWKHQLHGISHPPLTQAEEASTRERQVTAEGPCWLAPKCGWWGHVGGAPAASTLPSGIHNVSVSSFHSVILKNCIKPLPDARCCVRCWGQ